MKPVKKKKCKRCKENELYYRNGLPISKFCTSCKKEAEAEKKEKDKLRKTLGNRKLLVKKLDAKVSKFIRERDKRCVICGSVEQLTNGHLFSRTTYSTRWDTTKDGNCHCQCWDCNYKHEFDPYPFTSWYLKKFGQKKLDELYQRYKTTVKYSSRELLEKIERPL